MIDDLLGAIAEPIGEAVGNVAGALAESIGDTVGSLPTAIGDAALWLVSGESESKQSDTDLPLQGMTIVVTGTLERFKRTEIEEVIECHGGRTSSSVSSKTSFVLVGAEPGSKLAKAQQLGVRIVEEQEFVEMIGGGDGR